MMDVFSLIMDDDEGGNRCLGIYTTFDKCYQMLKEDIDDKYFTCYDGEDIENFYSVYKVSLDNEIAECGDFTTDGVKIEIDWDKLFKEIEDEHKFDDFETSELMTELIIRLGEFSHVEKDKIVQTYEDLCYELGRVRSEITK